MKIMKAFNIIRNIILDIIIVILIGVVIFGFINKSRPVPIFNHYFFTVLTGSMQPELKAGDSIIVKKVDEYKVGDIVTYKMDKSYVTHRIIKIDGNKITTKGDANKYADEPFDKKYILGKFVYKSKFLNFLVNHKFLIILLVILLCLLSFVLKSGKTKETKEEVEII